MTTSGQTSLNPADELDNLIAVKWKKWEAKHKITNQSGSQQLIAIQQSAAPLVSLLKQMETALINKHIPVKVLVRGITEEKSWNLGPRGGEEIRITVNSHRYDHWEDQFRRQRPTSKSGNRLYPFGLVQIQGKDYVLLDERGQHGEQLPIVMQSHLVELFLSEGSVTLDIECFQGIIAPLVSPPSCVEMVRLMRNGDALQWGVNRSLQDDEMKAFGKIKPKSIGTSVIHAVSLQEKNMGVHTPKRYYVTPEETVTAALELLIGHCPHHLLCGI